MIAGTMLYFSSVQEIQMKVDYHGMLYGDICQWSAHINCWRFSALDSDHGALTGNHQCKLRAKSRCKFDAGAAKGGYGSSAALMSFFGIFMGSIAMTIISLNWSNTILVPGIINI